MTLVRAREYPDPLLLLEESNFDFHEMRWGSSKDNIWLYVEHDEGSLNSLQTLLSKAEFEEDTWARPENVALGDWTDCVESWVNKEKGIRVDVVKNLEARQIVSGALKGFDEERSSVGKYTRVAVIALEWSKEQAK